MPKITEGRRNTAYHRLREELRERILAGQWPTGSMIPARNDLAMTYDVAAKTVQRAVAALVDEGVLRTVQRRGTFVADPEATDRGAHTPSAARKSSQAMLAIVAQPDFAMRSGDYQSSWVLSCIQAMEQVFGKDGEGITRFYSVGRAAGELFETPREAIRSAVEEGADAIAVVNLTEYEQWYQQAISAVGRKGPPIVFVWGNELRSPHPHVVIDQWSNGYLAAMHLLDAGYRRLAFFAPVKPEWLVARIAGARQAATDRGLPSSDFVTEPSRPGSGSAEYRKTDGQERADWILRMLDKVLEQPRATTRPEKTLGLICPNDHEALLVARGLEKRGVKLGRDVGLIGFDDHHDSRLMGLTTLRPPLEDLGATAAQIIKTVLAGGRPPVETRLSSTLVPRTTTYVG